MSEPDEELEEVPVDTRHRHAVWYCPDHSGSPLEAGMLVVTACGMLTRLGGHPSVPPCPDCLKAIEEGTNKVCHICGKAAG